MQLKLSKGAATHETELRRLYRRVEDDYMGALSDHESRMLRFTRYYRRWRNRVDPPVGREAGKPNCTVPMIQWQVFGRVSKEMQRLLGDDAEVIAKPVGPSDYRVSAKVGAFVSWRLFDSMRITNPLSVFTFRKVLFGRSHAYRPWVRDIFRTQGPQVALRGPGFLSDVAGRSGCAGGGCRKYPAILVGLPEGAPDTSAVARRGASRAVFREPTISTAAPWGATTTAPGSIRNMGNSAR